MSRRIKGGAGPSKPKKKVTTEPGLGDALSKAHLVWRFGRISHAGDFGVQKLILKNMPELERELAAFQEAPIYQLKKLGWLKFIHVDHMTPKGQRCLKKINKQEDGLWQLHLSRHKWRIWGYFEEPEFYFLWWDGEHDVATGNNRRRRT